jgi:hypothetical protein
MLSALPPGAYTLRALRFGHQPAPAQQVRVEADRNAFFALSLLPLARLSDREMAEHARELTWLLRHRLRSVLEGRAPTVADARPLAPPRPWLGGLAGSVEMIAEPMVLATRADAGLADGPPVGFSVVRLDGRLAESAHLRLGGFVAQSGDAVWRTAAQLSLRPFEGHELTAEAAWGRALLRPAGLTLRDGASPQHGVGAIQVQDQWQIGPVKSSLGLRYSYVGFLADPNHLDPETWIEVQREDGTRARAGFSRRTLFPGGDPLSLSPLSTAPAGALVGWDARLRPERVTRYDLSVDRRLGRTAVAAHTFYETVQDPLQNLFDRRSLRIANGSGLATAGVGVSVTHSFGQVLRGSMTYTYGRGRREAAVGPPDDLRQPLAVGAAGFHDLVTRVETVIDRSGTRLLVLYRINALNPDSELPTLTTSRFDLQLRQGLPFLGSLTRADWEVLLAYRNLFYEATEGATLDELAVVDPPRRLLGGLSVRF